MRFLKLKAKLICAFQLAKHIPHASVVSNLSSKINIKVHFRFVYKLFAFTCKNSKQACTQPLSNLFINLTLIVHRHHCTLLCYLKPH